MKKMLIVVDPQVDFITGSLSVETAEDTMNKLSQYINDHSNEYAIKVCTLDWHPYSHCSFTENGGIWPRHCVAHSMGASVWPSVFNALNESSGETYFLKKGTKHDREEYSIFKNFASANWMMSLVKNNSIEEIDICGIAYDVCVFNTLKDALKRFGGKMLGIIPEFCPSITKEGCDEVDKFITDNQIRIVKVS